MLHQRLKGSGAVVPCEFFDYHAGLVQAVVSVAIGRIVTVALTVVPCTIFVAVDVAGRGGRSIWYLLLRLSGRRFLQDR